MIVKEKGQVLVLVLLIMGASLALGVTISKRAIDSLKNTTSVESSSECLIHAESGIEDALQKLNSSYLGDINFCDAATSTGVWDDLVHYDPQITVCDVDTSNCGDGSILNDENNDFAYCIWKANVFDRRNIEHDKAFTLPLRMVPPLPDSIRIHWNGPPILDLAIIGENNVTGNIELLGSYNHDPLLFDGCDLGGNNLLDSYPSPLVDGGIFVDINLSQFNMHDRLVARLKFLCGNANHVVMEGLDATKTRVPLPEQYYQINAVCLNQPVLREVEVVKDLPAVSNIFDFAIFSGSPSSAFDL